MERNKTETLPRSEESGQSQRIIAEAFQKLEASLYPVDARHFRAWSLKDVQETAKIIQRDQEERQCIRNLRRIKPLFAALDRLGGVVDTLCQGTPYLCFIWAPIKLVLTIGNEYILGFEKLVDAYGQIAQHLPRLDRLSKAFQDVEEFQVIISEVLADLLDFHWHAYRFLRRGGWKHLFDASWKSFAPRFDGILQSLARNRDLVDREANCFEILEAKRCRALLIQDIEKREIERRDQFLLATLNWLDLRGQDCDQENRLDEYDEVRLKGTCEWVLDHPKVISWLDEDDRRPYLWIKGKPGAGKTTIAAHIIRNGPIPPKATVLYCLCTYGVGKENTNFRSFMLRLLIAQILRSKHDLVAFAYDEVASGNSPTDTRLRLLLQKLIASLEMTYIIVDGLDECVESEQRRVLKELLELPVDNSSCELHRVKILVCSRETSETLRMLSKSLCISLTDEQARVSKDIALHVKASLAELKSDYEDDLIDTLEQQIISKADGMFLWAKLVVALAFEQKSIQGLKNVAMKTPAGLDGIYASIIERFNNYPDEQRRRAESILGWVAFGFRNLKSFELCDLLVFEACDMKLDAATKLLKSVLDICKPLIEEKDDHTTVLVHFSAREYLLSTRSGPYLPAWSTNARIAASSLRYLFTCLIFLEPASSLTAKYEILKGFHDLFPYVYEFWTEHYCATLSARPKSARDVGICETVNQLLQNFEARWVSAGTLSNQRAEDRVSLALMSPEELPYEQDLPVLSVSRIEPSKLVESYTLFRKSSAGKQLTAKNVQDLQMYEATNADSDAREQDPTRLSEAFVSFQSIFESLFECPPASVVNELSTFDITTADLRTFHERHSGAAYRCNYRGCTVAAFKSIEEREKHQLLHSESLRCPDPSCDRVRDAFTRQALRKHVLKYHSELIEKPLLKFRIRRHEGGTPLVSENGGYSAAQYLPTSPTALTDLPLQSQLTTVPKSLPELSPQDNKAINLRAAALTKGTSKEEMRNIVDRMDPKLRQNLAKRAVDPIIYYFRKLATKEFRRQKQRELAANPPADALQWPDLTPKTHEAVFPRGTDLSRDASQEARQNYIEGTHFQPSEKSFTRYDPEAHGFKTQGAAEEFRSQEQMNVATPFQHLKYSNLYPVEQQPDYSEISRMPPADPLSDAEFDKWFYDVPQPFPDPRG